MRTLNPLELQLTDSCELPDWVPGTEVGAFEEKLMLLTTEPSHISGLCLTFERDFI